MGRREADEHGRPAPNFVMLLHLSLDMDIQMASLEVSTLLAAQTRNLLACRRRRRAQWMLTDWWSRLLQPTR